MGRHLYNLGHIQSRKKLTIQVYPHFSYKYALDPLQNNVCAIWSLLLQETLISF